MSTLDDLTKWDAALYSDKLVKQDLLAKIWTPTKLSDGSTNSYGYGWFSTTYRGIRELNHSGQTNGFTCFYRRFPEKRCSVWTFCNTYGGNVFDLTNLATAHFVPGASYLNLPVPANDPDPARSALHFKALRQAVYAEGGDLLTPNIKNFSTHDRYKEIRSELKGYLDRHKEWALVRVSQRTTGTGQKVDDHLYKEELADGDFKFWTLGFIEGKLAGIRVEDE